MSLSVPFFSLIKTHIRGFKRYHEYARGFGHDPIIYQGGPLPRMKYSDLPKPTPMPDHNPSDSWSPKKAYFGQNDYIDILGDGGVKPKHLTTGPAWLRGFQGKEYHRLLRRLQFEGQFIRQKAPSQYYKILIRMKHLYWRYNYKHTGKKYSVFIDA
ncbi:hypothetical protein ACOME3_000885 [Neoechinorhynchus agilis]